MKKQKLTWPEIGEKVLIPGAGFYSVTGPCANKNAGHWYCHTHDTHFHNQFEKDTHICLGEHKLVWCCESCGALEVDPKWSAQ